ncbi:MAG TPA: zinc ribbon domain-containing protein [Thermoanaerobaculia bacterium]|nr:zinc ribbon domain-containing protein [Thermoanaerobaculia bacterium]
MPHVEFTGNYQDLSTDKGFQFKFFCEKCNNGYMSTFQSSKLGMATSALEAANNLFGGLFGRAASTAYEIQRAVGGPAHDAALDDATKEIRPLFEQCTRCGNWVCKPVCFNAKAQLCESCAPDLTEELAAAQAEAAREQVQAKAREVDWMASLDVATVTGAQCTSCKAKLAPGAKFCPECGTPVQSVKRFCTGCGKAVEGNPKFCPDCGEKLG